MYQRVLEIVQACVSTDASINLQKYKKLVFPVSRKYPNLVRSQVEMISDPNYLVRILVERYFSKHLI